MLFSIITPVLDRREMLQKALQSVRAQDYREFEHIVVDGGSTDGTLELLESYPDVAVIGDRRKGIYDAMNLGLERARGDIIGFLNSDDWYHPRALSAAALAFSRAPRADVACGAAELVEGNRLIASYDSPQHFRLDPHSTLIGPCIMNARFFRRLLFDRIGAFSLKYPLIADRNMLAKAIVGNVETVAIERCVYTYRKHPESSTYNGRAETARLLRSELLQLAGGILAAEDASRELLSVAHALQGRCLVAMALDQLYSGQLTDCVRSLTSHHGHPSAAPLVAVATGLFDLLLRGRMGS